MSHSSDDPPIGRVPLAEPRPLTVLERGLVDFMLGGRHHAVTVKRHGLDGHVTSGHWSGGQTRLVRAWRLRRHGRS